MSKSDRRMQGLLEWLDGERLVASGHRAATIENHLKNALEMDKILNERPPSGEMVMVPREPTKTMLSAAGWALGDYYAKEGGWCGHKAGEEQARLTYIAMLSEAEGGNGYAFTVDRKQFCSPQKRASIAELKAIYGRGGDEFWFVKDPSNKLTGRKTFYDAEIVDLEFTSEFYVDLPARM